MIYIIVLQHFELFQRKALYKYLLLFSGEFLYVTRDLCKALVVYDQYGNSNLSQNLVQNQICNAIIDYTIYNTGLITYVIFNYIYMCVCVYIYMCVCVYMYVYKTCMY